MSTPLALCLERLGGGAGRFTRCVALNGRQAGLGIAADGAIAWQSDPAVQFCVTLDGKLALYRPEDTVASTLHRAGRCLHVPCAKPVIVLDQDELSIGGERFRIHLHGPAPAIRPPLVLSPDRSARVTRAAATVAAAGLLAVAGCSKPEDAVEVRDNPPVVAPDEPPVLPELPDSDTDSPAHRDQAQPSDEPIDVRVQPTGPVVPDEPPPDAQPVPEEPIEVREAPPLIAPIEED